MVRRVLNFWRTNERAGRKADTELVDTDSRASRHDEMAELVDDHERDEDGKQ